MLNWKEQTHCTGNFVTQNNLAYGDVKCMGVAQCPALLIMTFSKSIVLKAWFVFARACEFLVTFVKKNAKKRNKELQPPLNNLCS
jgi:hypothetical protein